MPMLTKRGFHVRRVLLMGYAFAPQSLVIPLLSYMANNSRRLGARTYGLRRKTGAGQMRPR